MMSDTYKREGGSLPPDWDPGWNDRESVVVGQLVVARAALLHLRALNGSTHYHDAMRGVSYAARALGVRPDLLNTLAEAYMRGEGGE